LILFLLLIVIKVIVKVKVAVAVTGTVIENATTYLSNDPLPPPFQHARTIINNGDCSSSYDDYY
jgi:hypothetical protein